ncbi:MAG: HTTM domain-containing protein [Acidimicrobiia bacterium]|nr:HTTM domain-containing protein [Acidimicrobiia bacterium]
MNVAIAETATDAPRWETLFDRTGSVRAIAVMRIAVGLATVVHLRPFLLGEAYEEHFWEPFVSWFPHPPAAAWFAMLWVGAGAAVLMTIGLWTRTATVLTLLVVAANLLISQTHFGHNRAFLVIVLGGLALLGAGRALSVDAWLRRRRRLPPVPDEARLWPLFLLRAQVSLVYLASGISKLVDPDWFGGLVLWDRVVRYRHVLDPTPLPGWAIDVLTSRWLYYAVGPAAVATELFIGVGLWFGRTRLAAIWVAIVFHVAIDISARVEVFSYVAIAALTIWVTPSARDRVVLVGTTRSGQLVSAMVMVGDWFGRFRLQRTGAPTPVAVVDRDGSRLDGPAAVRFALSRLPAAFAFSAPLLLLAGRRRRAS